MRLKNVLIGVLCLLILGVVVFAIIGGQNAPIVRSISVRLNVLQAPDFAINVSPAFISTYPDRTVAFVVTALSSPTFTGEVVFTVSGVPAGVTAAFSPGDRVTLGGEDQKAVQLNLVVAPGAAVGEYDLTITATSTNYN